MTRGSLPRLATAVLLAAGLCSVAAAAEPADEWRQQLAAAAHRLAADIQALPPDPPAERLFSLLEQWHPGVGDLQVAAASVWDVRGRALAWTGRPTAGEPQPPPSAATVVLGPPAVSGSRRALAWSPLGQGSAVLVEANLPPAPRPAVGQLPSGRVLLLTLAAALLAAGLAAGWRHGAGARLTGLGLLTAGLWTLRTFLAMLVRAAAPWAGALATPALFASEAPWGLYRSPLDLLLTALTLTAQAGLLLRWLRRGDAARPFRAGLGLTSAVALLYGLRLSARAGLDSRLDLSGLSGGETSAAQVAVQVALVLGLWAPALVLAAAGAPGRRGRSPWIPALLAAAAAVVVFVHGGIAAEEARQDLTRDHLAPMLRRQSEERAAALEESRQQLSARPGLADDLAVAVTLSAGDALAFRLWQQTELAARGYRSSVELLRADGLLAGSFAIEMPPPVPSGAMGEAALFDVPFERLVFATLSQEEEVLSSRWTLQDADGRTVGAVALYVSDALDNVPALMGEPDLPAWTEAGRDVRRILGSVPIVLVHDATGSLLWSSLADPPPLPPLAGENSWLDADSAGRRLRLLRFSADGRVFSIGYRLDGWSHLAARLLRFIIRQLVLLAALAIVALLVLRPVGGWRRDLASLRAGIATSWGRKLAVIVLLASMPPLVGLAVLLRTPIARQRNQSLASLGLQAAEVARRVVKDAMVAVGGDEPGAAPSDETLYWLSRVVRQDIDLFVGPELAATSRRGLFTAGLASPLPDARAYRRIALQGGQVSLPGDNGDGDGPPAVTAALELPDGRLAMLRLPFRRQEAEVAQVGDEVRERADLATAGVALFLLVAAVAVGRGTARRLRRLTEATECLARGDEQVRVEDPSGDELGRATGAFNRMAQALSSQRAVLRRRTETLESLVRHAPTGIVHLDGSGRVLMANPAAARLLRLDMDDLADASGDALLASSPHAEGLRRLLGSGMEDAPHTRDLTPDDGGESRLRAVLVGLPGAGAERLLLLEDITESVRSGRLAAWADMARRIAHEIKNPLTPIRLSAEHLLRVHAAGGRDLDAILERTLGTILTQVDALRAIAADFSLYARLPEKRPVPMAPAEMLEEAVAPYRDSGPSGIEFRFEVEPDLPTLQVDPALIRRALVNLLENALQAMPSGGILSVRARRLGDRVEMSVSDSGEGMDAATLARVFEPYFSTRDAGTGLGLAIASRTVEDHGGVILATSAAGAGTTFSILLPASARSRGSR